MKFLKVNKVIFGFLALLLLFTFVFEGFSYQDILINREIDRSKSNQQDKDLLASINAIENADTVLNVDKNIPDITTSLDNMSSPPSFDPNNAECFDVLSQYMGSDFYNNQSLPPILYYHHIGDSYYVANKAKVDGLEVDTPVFDQQMKYLHDNNFRTISMIDWLKIYECGFTAPKKTVILTFDDGYRDFYTVAMPILKKYQIFSEIYIPTALINKNDIYMTWDMLKEIRDSGIVKINSHTINHKDLPLISSQQAFYELYQSKLDIQNKLGITQDEFCYPYGSTSATIEQLVAKAGYSLAITTGKYSQNWSGDLFKIPRFEIVRTMPLYQFIGYVNS